jgi:hypothetical protein
MQLVHLVIRLFNLVVALLQRRIVVIALFGIIAIVAAVQKYALTVFEDDPIGPIDNYLCFAKSSEHLRAEMRLYGPYREEYHCYYLYTPTFALAFTPLAMLPTLPGSIIWCLLNAVPLVLALSLFKTQPWKKAAMYGLMILPMVGMLQNHQSNGLLAALMLFTYWCLEDRRTALAALCVVCAAFIKAYGAAIALLFLFYPEKPKAILYGIMWGLLLLVAPLIVVSADYLYAQYNQWFGILLFDRSQSAGDSMSVMTGLQRWTGLAINQTWVQLAGTLVFLVPLVRVRSYRDPFFRVLFLCSLLIWVVIFNHAAESPTYPIAFAGMVVWFAVQETSWLTVSLMLLALAFGQLTGSDLVPRSLRRSFFTPYLIKMVPCLLVWICLQVQLLHPRVARPDSARGAGAAAGATGPTLP